MSNLDDFSGSILEIPPTSIIRASTTTYATNCDYPAYYGLCATALSGAMTANVYKTSVLSITGRGVMPFLIVYANDATSRTVAAKINIDGAQVVERTGIVLNASNAGFAIIGWWHGSGSLSMENIPFRSSLTVDLRSSVTETDKLTIGYCHRLG